MFVSVPTLSPTDGFLAPRTVPNTFPFRSSLFHPPQPAPDTLLLGPPRPVHVPFVHAETDVPVGGNPLSVAQHIAQNVHNKAVVAADDDNASDVPLSAALKITPDAHKEAVLAVDNDAPDAHKETETADNDDTPEDVGSPALTPIPQNVIIKPLFEERYRQLFGDQYDGFIKYSLSYIRKCIRVNTLKISVEELKRRLEPTWNLIPVSWCPEGFFISHKNDERFDLGNLIEHQLGYIYIQDAASMIPPVVLMPEPGERVLDLCAAPGSKTTQLAQYLNNNGLLVANDADLGRLKPLGLNLQRCGVTCAIVTLRANERMRELGLFDKVLVDAPCSGTGTVRRSLKTLLMWGPGLPKQSR